MEYKVIIFWSCIALVLIAAFGWTAFSKIRALNSKYHIITYDNDSVYVDEED